MKYSSDVMSTEIERGRAWSRETFNHLSVMLTGNTILTADLMYLVHFVL